MRHCNETELCFHHEMSGALLHTISFLDWFRCTDSNQEFGKFAITISSEQIYLM